MANGSVRREYKRAAGKRSNFNPLPAAELRVDPDSGGALLSIGTKGACGLRILIAIPVYNELKYAPQVIEKVKRFHPDVLFVDDGSTDGTYELLAKRDDIYLIRHAVNRGYGQSLIDAFAFADRHGYDWVITMDCDEQHEPEMIPEFIRKIEEDRWDIISGSRYLENHPGDDLPPGDRRSINLMITETINDLYNWGLTDSFCGFKAHRVSAMRKLDLTEPGYAFPMQLWPQVYKAGLRLTEIPVRLIYNDPTRHFGGLLDDATLRLQHYMTVLSAENRKPAPAAVTAEDAAACSCCCGK
jgi:dolichol-phosphate mannosyltransferase